MTLKKTSLLAAFGLVPALLVSGCGSSDDSTTITVYAAASLTDSFNRIGQAFEAQHPGVTVTFDFGGSSDLVTQLQQGAQADVFASADTTTMGTLTGSGLNSEEPQDFASNTLEIATPPGNPAKITSFQDLTRSGAKVVVCAAEVPCGAATQKVEQATGITLDPVSEEQSVTDVLGKVSSGDADAGLVYVTDVKTAGDSVEGVTFPQAKDAVNVYPITTLKDSDQADLAGQFVDFVISSSGQQVLASDGFASAPTS